MGIATWATTKIGVAVAGALLCALPVTAERARTPVSMSDLEDGKVKLGDRVRFTHLDIKPFKNGVLRSVMTTREGKRFERRFFRNDLATLENLYRGAGYLSVKIVRRVLELDERGKLHIRIKIDSGPRWKVAAVAVEVEGQGADHERARGRIRVAEGQHFRYADVLADERDVLTFLNSRGYAHARVENQIEYDPATHTAEVLYRIDPGLRMYFGAIEIVGRAGVDAGMKTDRSLVLDHLAFREGQRFNPVQLRRTRNRLAQTNLFRSVTVHMPKVAQGDSVQPVQLQLQERKFIHLEADAFINNEEPGLSGNARHENWLGRGTRIGVDASLGRPVQGATFYLTEPTILDLPLDFTVAAGVSDEWEGKKVSANPNDSLQFAQFAKNHSIVWDMIEANELGLGDLFEIGPEQFIESSQLSYDSVERLWKIEAILARRWESARSARYETQLALTWEQSRNQPVSGGVIGLNQQAELVPAAPDTSDDPLGDDPFGDDDPFGGDDPFGDDDPFADSGKAVQEGAPDVDYLDGQIPVTPVWRAVLRDKAKTVNASIAFQRDSRDNQIAPSRGSYLRASVLYAVKVTGRSSQVVDGELEGRYYQPLGRHLVWALATRWIQTASLQNSSAMPQAYWIELGGEGSVRGVNRNMIIAVDGGRTGLNLRSEFRVRVAGFGGVLFWDRAGVWRELNDANWSTMTDGYGFGLRYDLGIPLRLDVGWSGKFDRREIYFSIGQAF